MGGRMKGALLGVVAIAILGAALPALASLSESKKTVPLVYPGRDTATASCGHKAYVAFGGFKTVTEGPSASDYFAFIDSMGPKKKADGWAATAHNISAIHDATVTSYAYCTKGGKPKVAKATKTAQPGAGKPSTVEVSCQKGKTLLGGGFSSNADPALNQRIVPTGLRRAGKAQTWQVSIVNEGSTAVKITAVALCGKGKPPKEVEATANLKEFAAPRGAVATCPKGKQVLFSGLDAEWDNDKFVAALPTGLYRSKKAAVTAVGVFGGGGGGGGNDSADLRAFAYCR